MVEYNYVMKSGWAGILLLATAIIDSWQMPTITSVIIRPVIWGVTRFFTLFCDWQASALRSEQLPAWSTLWFVIVKPVIWGVNVTCVVYTLVCDCQASDLRSEPLHAWCTLWVVIVRPVIWGVNRYVRGVHFGLWLSGQWFEKWTIACVVYTLVCDFWKNITPVNFMFMFQARRTIFHIKYTLSLNKWTWIVRYGTA